MKALLGQRSKRKLDRSIAVRTNIKAFVSVNFTIFIGNWTSITLLPDYCCRKTVSFHLISYLLGHKV